MLITQLYKRKPGGIEEHSNVCNDRIAKLKVFQDKSKKELLAVFSANVTGNPHYFDEGRQEKLLFNYLGERNFDLNKKDFPEQRV